MLRTAVVIFLGLTLLLPSPNQASAQVSCFPGMSTCFTVTEFRAEAVPFSPTYVNLFLTLLGKWGYWDSEWNSSALFWRASFSSGTQLTVGGSGIEVGDGRTAYLWDGLFPGALVGDLQEVSITEMRIYSGSEEVLSCGLGAACDIVPEPGTVILLGTGLLGLGFVAWRRKEEG